MAYSPDTVAQQPRRLHLHDVSSVQVRSTAHAQILLSHYRQQGRVKNDSSSYVIIHHTDRCSINLLKPNDHYSGRTAPLTSKRCILYIYSTNVGTEYFKHGIYSPFLSPQNAVCFIILTYLVPVLCTFYIQSVLKLKKNNSGAKRLRNASEINFTASYA